MPEASRRPEDGEPSPPPEQGDAHETSVEPTRTAIPAPRLAAAPPRHGLGWWALCIAILALGVGLLYARWLHAGGIVMASGFGLAALVRLVRPDGSGGLQVRSRAVDVVFYLAAAINVLGAVLLVERLLALRVLGLVNVALVALVALLWARAERERHRHRS